MVNLENFLAPEEINLVPANFGAGGFFLGATYVSSLGRLLVYKIPQCPLEGKESPNGGIPEDTYSYNNNE